MTTQVHGHDVMEMMIASKRSYTTESLKAAIVAQFGAEARFHTCSAENMDAGELIAFLAQRGKFTATPDGFVVLPDSMCQH